MRDSPLVASTAAMHLAAVVLNTFPSNAHLEPTAADRTGAKATALRRAIAYIDESAHLDISIGDIAKHVSMTPAACSICFAANSTAPQWNMSAGSDWSTHTSNCWAPTPTRHR